MDYRDLLAALSAPPSAEPIPLRYEWKLTPLQVEMHRGSVHDYADYLRTSSSRMFTAQLAEQIAFRDVTPLTAPYGERVIRAELIVNDAWRQRAALEQAVDRARRAACAAVPYGLEPQQEFYE